MDDINKEFKNDTSKKTNIKLRYQFLFFTDNNLEFDLEMYQLEIKTKTRKNFLSYFQLNEDRYLDPFFFKNTKSR